MIHGHGDDTYLYRDIQMNFSSNIFASADMSELKEHLCRHINLISNYPEPEASSLEALLAQKHGIAAECVVVTNGATDAIYLVAQTFAHALRHFATDDIPTFSEYADASTVYGLTSTTWSGTSGNGGAVSTSDTLLWLCNPNNPTGSWYTHKEIMEATARHALVVVDQSYEDLTLNTPLQPSTAVQLSNLIQIHSLTKTYAIPGLRVGYITASPALAAKLREHLRPWAVSSLAIEAGRWLIEHQLTAIRDLHAYLNETRRLRQQLNAIPGIDVLDTCTNFMLAHIRHATAAQLKHFLATQHHILIRDASNFKGLTPHHFRISTQMPYENNKLISAIRDFTCSKLEK